MDYQPDFTATPADNSPNLQCIKRSVRIFHENFLYLGLAFLPLAVFAYGIRTATIALTRSMAPALIHRSVRVPYGALALFGAINWGSYCLAAVVFGFVSGGIAVAVRELRSGNDRPALERALDRPRERLAAIAFSAVIQTLALMVGVSLSILLSVGFAEKLGIRASQAIWGGWAAMALCVAVLSRWTLSVPAIIEEGCGVWASFRRSQELAGIHTPAILFFVAHATVAGYIAGMIPYYAFNFVAGRTTLPEWSTWIPFVFSFVFVAWTEPLYAVGIAEVYYSAREREARTAEANADSVSAV